MPVVTQAELTAIAAAQDALAKRTAALTMPVPVVPPVVLPSPDGTTVTTIGPAIVDTYHRRFTLVTEDATLKGQQIAIDGVRDARTGLAVRLYAKGGVAYHENTAHQWWHIDNANAWQGPDPDPTGATPPVTPPVASVPPPAAAVGYVRKTISSPVVLGANWSAITGANIRINADGTITISGGGSTYNNQISASPVVTGGFYAEATLSWTGVAVWVPGDGWPAWWSTNVAAGIGMVNTEADFMEGMSGANAYDTGLHNWNADGTDTNSGPGTVAVPAGTDFSRPHKFGFLFVPATGSATGYAKWFFDGVQNKEIRIGQTGLYSSLATQPSTMLLGSGTKNPMTVFTADVWQRP